MAPSKATVEKTIKFMEQHLKRAADSYYLLI